MCGQTFEAKKTDGESIKRPISSTRIQAQLFVAGEVVGGRYKIIDELGRSGVGVVYRAYDQEIDADVALKAVSPNLLQTDEERKLFSREVKAARKLHHPNIVRIYDEGAKGDQRYFTMKLLEGLTLRKIISLRHEKGQSFSSEEIAPIMHQIAAALDYAHKTTWHGDLKPENVIILPDLLKLTDFNIVKGLPLKPFLGLAKSRSNTYAYVAPELKVEAQTIDGRCDIYSLGVILGEMLTGLVYEGHFTRAFSTALERLPPKVDGLVRRALSEHPDGRFPKATELATELEKALEQLIGGQLPPPVRPATAVTAKPPPPPEETEASLIDHTDEDLAVQDDPSLEEIGASQVILLDNDGAPPADEWDRDTDMARRRPAEPETQEGRRRRDSSLDSTPGLGPAVSVPSEEVSRDRMKAEDLGEVLYSDDEDLVPPPLPADEKLNRSESFDSLPPDGIAVSGSSDVPDFLGAPTVDDSPRALPADPAAIGQDLSEEPTRTDGSGGLGIHDALTALKDHPRPDLVSDPSGKPVVEGRQITEDGPVRMSGDGASPGDKTNAVLPPPPILDDDDGLDEQPATASLGANLPGRTVPPPGETSGPASGTPTHKVNRAVPPHLPPPIVGPAPTTAKVQRPVAPPKEKKRGGGILLVAGLFLALVVVGLVGWQVWERMKSGELQIGKVAVADAGPATPIQVVEVDAGAPTKVAQAPEVAPAPEATPESAPETALNTTTPEAQEPEVTPEASPNKGRKRKSEDAASRRKKEEEERKKAEDERKKEAERQAREEMEAREREERLAAKREREADAKRKKEEEREARLAAKREREAEAKRKKEEAARKKAEEEKKLAMAKKGTCPRGMRKIPAGRFKFGSSTSDPMRNFGEKIATTVSVPEYCIDYYEYPNSKSRKPTTGVSWSQAKASCARKGKRLCTEVEWERACKGPSGRRFPYGNTFKDGICNTEDADGVARPMASAKEYPRCRSGFTVINAAGNAEEWTSDSFKPGSRSMTVKGGAADRPDFASRCAARRGASKSTTRKSLGFRCCADVQ